MTFTRRLLLQTACLAFLLSGTSFLSPLIAQEITGLSGFTIFIDPGHSQTENQGAFGYSEPQKVLRVGLELQRLLMERTDIDTAYILRTNDSQLYSLSQRTSLANSLNPDFYYSIHSDAGSTTAHSTLTMYGGWRSNGVTVEKNPTGGKDFGDILSPTMTAAAKMSARGNYADRTFYQGFPANSTNKWPYLHVNRTTNMASLLSEGGFHTNPYQQQRNLNADYKRLEARAAFWSVLEYLGVDRPVEGILTGEIKDLDTELFVNGATITVQGKSVTTDTFESLFNQYSSDPDQLRNGFYYIDGLTPGPAEVIISGADYDSDTLQVDIKSTDMTYLNASIRNNLLPAVDRTTPVEGDTTHNPGEFIYIYFNKNMNRASVEGAISIIPEAEIDFSWAGSKRVGITTSNLEFETNYTITIDESPTDDSPSALKFDGDKDGEVGGTFTLNFKTGPADITAPKVVGIDPFKTTTLTTTALVNITFDELLDHSTISDQSIHLEATGLENITGTVKVYDVFERSVITFFPNQALAKNTTFTTVLAPGIADLTGNVTEVERRANFTSGDLEHKFITDIYDFESGLTDWWEPTQSGSTTGYLSDFTSFESTGDITNLLSGSTSAMRLNYGFETAKDIHLIREYLERSSPKFSDGFTLQAYVFGDGNGNKMRFVVRDNDNELEASAWTTVDWIGWKLVTWDLGDDEVVAFANGDGVIDGSVYFDSFQLTYTVGQPNKGFIVFDDLKAVTFQGATSSEDEFTNDTPNTLSLDQNYPNPFNPSTNIRFALPAKTEVRLEVFDMLGRKVETVFNGVKSAGSHTVTFDASGLASGVYIYKLSTATQVVAKKMLLMK
tara:strand:- start:25295 stop:27817 length:2523 start_codon:yes stop_codon:yes gene_type:complete